MYLYRAIDSVGDTVDFWLSEHRDLPAAKRFSRKALTSHGRPERIVLDGSQTNREAIIACDAEPVAIRCAEGAQKHPDQAEPISQQPD